MKNILQITDTTIVDSVSIATEVSSNSSFWFWIAVIQFLIILFLLMKWSKSKKKDNDEIRQKLKNAKNQDVDMNDLMLSINNSKALYKEMSRACHPDRFSNEETKKIAEAIFQEITRNKRDYKKLKEIMSVAENKLNITIKNQ